jgi:predicted ATP-dependent protease
MAARVVFEQSYGGVEGDSASAAELIAILSALAQVPLRQNLALTGSVNQRGELQAIGGVNEKVEGFFEVCRMKNGSGDNGVIIPAANARHLVVKDEVVGAVEQGSFHIHSAQTVNEVISILTGEDPGEQGSDGSYPEGSFNRKVADRLHGFEQSIVDTFRALGGSSD